MTKMLGAITPLLRSRLPLDQSGLRRTHHFGRGASVYSSRLCNPSGVAPGYDDHDQGVVADDTRRDRGGEYDCLRTAGICQRVQAVLISRHHGNTNERRPACRVRVLEGTVQHWTAAGADSHRARYSGTPATRRLNKHVLDQRGQLLRAALALHTLRSWLDSWAGIGRITVGMARQGYDLQHTRYDEKGCRAIFYVTGMEHSPTSVTGSAWERTPWHAVQRAAWEALRQASRDG